MYVATFANDLVQGPAVLCVSLIDQGVCIQNTT